MDDQGSDFQLLWRTKTEHGRKPLNDKYIARVLASH